MYDSTWVKIGVVGCGGFSINFIRLFLKHPFVESVCVADNISEKAKSFGEMFNMPYYDSFEKMLEADINAVAIFAPRYTHGPFVIKTLQCGKNVYSAVLMASEITHCQENC